MVPFAGKPAIHYIAMPYANNDYRVVIAVNEAADDIGAYFRIDCGLHAQLVSVGHTRQIAETILKVLEAIADVPEEVVINFGDTYVADGPLSGDRFYAAQQPDSYRWTTFEIDGNGSMGPIHEKHTIKPSGHDQLVFVGAFSFSNPRLLVNHLHAALRNPISLSTDAFYLAVQTYYAGCAEPHFCCTRACQWFDLGHVDTYYAARQQRMGERAFNTVKVDPQRGLLTKKSKHTQKFVDEIAWYLKLPPHLHYIAPRVFSHSLDQAQPFLEMEFYGYPPLSDTYVFGNLDLEVWTEIFNALNVVLNDMGRHHLRAERATIREALRDMYVRKTTERLAQIRHDPRFAEIFFGRLRVNGLPVRPLAEAMEHLETILETAGLLNADTMCVIHGDLCFSNILYDRRSRLIRLVDPRGRFGPFDIYGDARYELAKLSHSVNGGYDFLVNGLFHLEQTEDEIVLHVFESERHREIQRLFNERVLAGAPGLLRQVRLLEALLFLSMAPLHADKPRSQLAFLARGLELLRPAYQNTTESPEPNPGLWRRDRPLAGAVSIK
jgi:hypothetical protein